MQVSWRKCDAVKQHFIWPSCIWWDCSPKYKTANRLSGTCCYIWYKKYKGVDSCRYMAILWNSKIIFNLDFLQSDCFDSPTVIIGTMNTIEFRIFSKVENYDTKELETYW